MDEHLRCCGLWLWSHPDKHYSNSKNVKLKRRPKIRLCTQQSFYLPQG